MEEEYISRVITYEDYKSITTNLLLKNNTNPKRLVQRIEDFLSEYYISMPSNCYSPILPLKPVLNENSEIYIKIKYNPTIKEDYIKKIILKGLRKKFKKELKLIKCRQAISCLL